MVTFTKSRSTAICTWLLYTLTLVWSRDYIYVSEPKTFDDAERYCLAQCNSHLATITNQNEIDLAISKIDVTDDVWIGLINVHQPPGWWKFIDNEECPHRYTGACVNEWRLGTPRSCEQGSICGIIDSELGEFDNDKDCDSLRPFLCNKEQVTIREYVTDGMIKTGWSESNNYCNKKYGTTLATVVSEDDVDNAIQLFLQHFPENMGFYVGLYEPKEEGNWIWADGTPCTRLDGLCTDFWDDGQPDNKPKGADCAALNVEGVIQNGYDFPCNWQSAVICNKPDD